MIVACMATREVWGHIPFPARTKVLILDPLRLFLTQSGTNFPNNIKVILATIITTLNFKICGVCGGWGGGGNSGWGAKIPEPPPLCMKT